MRTVSRLSRLERGFLLLWVCRTGKRLGFFGFPVIKTLEVIRSKLEREQGRHCSAFRVSPQNARAGVKTWSNEGKPARLLMESAWRTL
jgi:hypothetical protein